MRWNQRLVGWGLALSIASLTLGTLVVSPADGTPSIIFVKASGHSFFHASSSTSSISRPSISLSKSPSSGITRPQYSPPPIASGIIRPRTDSSAPHAANGSGISRPGSSPSMAARTPAPVQRSAADLAIARGQSAQAYSRFQQEQSKFKTPSVMVPQTRQAARQSPVWRAYGSRWHNSNEFYTARSRAILVLPPSRAIYWNAPPVWVLNGRPAYGSFNGAFLGSLLGTGVGNAFWYYSHMNDPAVIQWHQDMMMQAANNPDLQSQIDALNAQVAQLQGQHAATDPNTLPEGVDPSLVVAPDTVLVATASDSDYIEYMYFALAIVITLGILMMFMRPRRRIV